MSVQGIHLSRNSGGCCAFQQVCGGLVYVVCIQKINKVQFDAQV